MSDRKYLSQLTREYASDDKSKTIVDIWALTRSLTDNNIDQLMFQI